MRPEYQIGIAVLLDQLLGDPRWFPHPVRLIGRLALWFEKFFRSMTGPGPAGVLTVLATLLVTGGAALFLLRGAELLHPWLGAAMGILLLYTAIAARDLVRHGERVSAALQDGDINEARRRVGMIVGRDTANLDERGVARAAVESVAESMVDGVTAPLFFAVLAGPLGAMLYKAVNTMDSMFGYRNEPYEKFGWAPARLDDLANFLPARLTAVLVPLAAFFLRLDWKNSWRILKRDRLNHASPNSAHAEAAVAGALGIRLGGPNHYFGKLVEKPAIGDRVNRITAAHILQTNRLMLFTSGLSLALFLGVRLLLTTGF